MPETVPRRLVVLPARARDVAAHDALDRQHLQAAHDQRPPARLRRHALGRRDHVVGDDLPGLLEPEHRQPREHLALVGDRRRVDRVVRRDAVARDHQQRRRRGSSGRRGRTSRAPCRWRCRGRSASVRHLARCYQRRRCLAAALRRSRRGARRSRRRSGCSGRSRRSASRSSPSGARARRRRAARAAGCPRPRRAAPAPARRGRRRRASMPACDEREQHALGEQRAVRQLEVLAHPLGVDRHALDQRRSRGAAGSRAGSSSPAGSRARPRSARCRARATARRSRAPACALPRSTRARPEICSALIGLRLCGIAEEPFCPARNGSCTSRTSVRCRWRISVARRSSPAPASAIAASSSAWRSRGDDLRRDVLARAGRAARARAPRTRGSVAA